MTDNGQAGKSGKLNGVQTPIFSAGFKTGKGTPHEGGTHVPSFWYWKNTLKSGVDIPSLTAHIDLYRTFCELAGVKIPNHIQKIDGRTLVPLLENPKALWNDRKLFIHKGRWEKDTDPNASKLESFAVRTQRWRFVNNAELYDISNDPYESTNVFDQYPEIVAELRKAYDRWWEETLPLMVNENVPYAQEQPQAVRYQKQLETKGIPNWIPPKL